MKKIILGFILIITLALSGVASGEDARDVRFGVKSGVSIAGLAGGEASGWDSVVGFTGGGYLRWKLSESFILQPELLYTMKGAAYTEDFGGDELKITLRIDYLEIPVAAKYVVPLADKFELHLFAGPVLGIEVRGKQEAEYRGGSTKEDIDGLSGADFGMIVGAGLDWQAFAEGSFNLDIRYSPGFTPVFSGGDEKNSVWAITAGYTF